MSFLAPTHLLWLVPVAALAAAYVVLQVRRRHHAVRFTNVRLLDALAPRRPGWRRHVAAAAVGLGLVSLVIGLARPVRDVKVPVDEATVMLAIDVSGSMAATDVDPSCLEAAKAAAEEFVAGVPDTVQVGVVAFAESASILSVPTTDHDAVIAAIDQLQTGKGTATGDGVSAALAALATVDSLQTISTADATTGDGATIVLLSDGAVTTGSALDDAAAAAVEQDVAITTIAYGTAEGTVVVDGQTVAVPADEAAMSDLASQTGGSFFTAASASELAQVYEDIQSRVGYTTEPREMVLTFLGVGLVALLVATAASMVWNGRFL